MKFSLRRQGSGHVSSDKWKAPLESPFASCKVFQEFLNFGFHAVDSGFQVLDPSLCQWNLYSGFQYLVGFRIPQAKFFWIAESWIPSSTWGDTLGNYIIHSDSKRLKTESTRILNNFDFQWAKILCQNNLKHIASFLTFFKG